VINFVFFLGLFFAGVGIFKLYRQKKQKEICSAQAEGTIIEIIKRKSPKSTAAYFPKYSFTVKGTEYVEMPVKGNNSPIFRPGEKITVCYNPNDPQTCFISQGQTGRSFGLFFTVIGVIAMILSFVVPV
jgi:hypothetical protein